MPRRTRKTSTTGIYHVMIRGVNKENIFRDDEDKKCFIRIAKYCLDKGNCILYAYCLMDNHVHLLIRNNTINELSNFMRELVGLYANIFNRKYERIGHLFQERYKSIVVEDTRYFIKLIKYIHQNPEKAKIQKTDKYLWSSYREYIYGSKIIDREYLLHLLDKDKKTAIKKLKDYLLDGNIINLKEEKLTTRDEINEKITEVIGNKKIETIESYNIIQRLHIAEQIVRTEKVNINLLAEILRLEKTKLYRIK